MPRASADQSLRSTSLAPDGDHALEDRLPATSPRASAAAITAPIDVPIQRTGVMPGLAQRARRAEMRGRLRAAAAQHHHHARRGSSVSAWSLRYCSARRVALLFFLGRGHQARHSLRPALFVDRDEDDVRRVRHACVRRCSASRQYTSTVMSIDELPTKSTVERQVTSDPIGIRSRKSTLWIDAVTTRPPAVPDRRDRRGLVHQRHQVAAEQVTENVGHVRHDERRDLAARVRHRTGCGRVMTSMAWWVYAAIVQWQCQS